MSLQVIPAARTAIAPVALHHRVQSDGELLGRLSKSGPRYTSYPTADRFSESFGYRDYLHAVAGLRKRGSAKPLSLYLHMLFCDTVCWAT